MAARRTKEEREAERLEIANRPPPTPPTESKDDIRDRAVGAQAFRYWLKSRQDPRYADLLKAMEEKNAFTVKFDRDRTLAALDYDEHLTELLMAAELEWRTDKQAGQKLRDHMDIQPDSRFDFRNPTMAHSHNCRFIKEGGTLCGGPAVPGTVRCQHHGGELVDAQTRRAILMTSYLQLVEGTAVAVSALLDVATSSRNDLARVNAAKEILDRAGLTAELQISVTIEGEGREQKLSALKSKLDAMQGGLQQRTIDAVSKELDD